MSLFFLISVNSLYIRLLRFKLCLQFRTECSPKIVFFEDFRIYVYFWTRLCMYYAAAGPLDGGGVSGISEFGKNRKKTCPFFSRMRKAKHAKTKLIKKNIYE